MSIFKKSAAFLLAVLMLAACFTACGKTETETTNDTADTADNADTAAAADEKTEIVFGTNAEFAPFEFVNSDAGVIDQFDGIDMVIAKQIGEENGMTAKIENMEFDSLIIALKNNQIDAVIAGMTITEERQQEVDFSVPYYQATQVMIVSEDSDIAKADDMAGKKIAVVQGYTGETCVADLGYEYEAFKKGTEAVLELVNGKCDVVVIDSATAQKYVDDNPGLKIVEDSSVFENEEYGIAVNKGNTELLDKINASIEKMLADGTISAISAQYLDSSVGE